MFLSLISTILFGNHQQQKLNFELRGVRLENATPALAKALGFDSLFVGPTIRNDVFLVRCKDVAPEVLKEKIAKAVNATWEYRPEGWWLTQTPDQMATDRAVFDSERLKKFTKIVDGIHKKADKMPEFNEATCKRLHQSIVALTKIERTDDNGDMLDKRVNKIDSNNPTERLGIQLARRVTPQMFMKLTKDRPKVVYCNRPTAMQIAIPFPVDDLLNQVIREQNLWIKAGGSDSVKVKVKSTDASEEDSYDQSFGVLNNSREPMLKESLSTVTLTLSRGQDSVEINVYSTKGEQTIVTNVDPSDDSSEGPSQQRMVSGVIEGEATAADDKKAEEAGPKGEAKEFIDIIYQGSRGRNQPSAAKLALLKKIIQPEKFDPLTFIAPDLAFSQIKNPNIVMVLDDPMSVPDGFDLAQMPEEPERKTVVDSSSDWFTCRFFNPIAVREDSVDRKIFGSIVRFLDQNRRELTVEENASLAFTEQWNLPQNGVFESLKSLFRQERRGQLFEIGFDREDPGDSGKRIYGSLTDGERRLGFNGVISVGSLSDATRRELYRAVYFGSYGRMMGRGVGLSVDFPNPENLTPEQEQLNQLVDGALQDPTFAMPNGIQSDYTLKLTEELHPTLSVSYKVDGNLKMIEAMGEFAPKFQVNPEDLGRMLYEFSKPKKPVATNEGESEPDYVYKIDMEHIRIVTSRMITVKMKTSKWLGTSWLIRGSAWNDPKTYTINSLPNECREGIQKGYAEAEQVYKDSKNQIKEEKPPIKKVPPPSR